jgi:hypothetical protein
MTTAEEICRDAFVEAMRARLAAQDPALAKNVDDEGVRKNLTALGAALAQVVDAHTRSDATADPAYWAWVVDVTAWLADVRAWQQAVTDAFQQWAPANPAESSLRSAVLGAPDPGAPPATAPAAARVAVR